MYGFIRVLINSKPQKQINVKLFASEVLCSLLVLADSATSETMVINIQLSISLCHKYFWILVVARLLRFMDSLLVCIHL